MLIPQPEFFILAIATPSPVLSQQSSLFPGTCDPRCGLKHVLQAQHSAHTVDDYDGLFAMSQLGDHFLLLRANQILQEQRRAVKAASCNVSFFFLFVNPKQFNTSIEQVLSGARSPCNPATYLYHKEPRFSSSCNNAWDKLFVVSCSLT